MPELVSIIIPAYNAEKWIAHTIRSAIDQTWPRKEIIVVDDGSTDNTPTIAKSFNSNKVKLIQQINSGQCIARNNGLSAAQGTYIQWLDADDLLAPDKIEAQMRRTENGTESRILLSGSWGIFFQNHHKARFRPSYLWQDLPPLDWIVHYFTDNTYICVHAWLTSRKLIELAGNWDSRLSKTDDDGEYYSRLVLASSEVRFVPEAKCYYRHGIPTSTSINRNRLSDEELVQRLLIEHLLEYEDSMTTRFACSKLLHNWLSFYYYQNYNAYETARRIALQYNLELIPPIRRFKWEAARMIFGHKFSLRINKKAFSFRSWLRRKREDLFL